MRTNEDGTFLKICAKAFPALFVVAILALITWFLLPWIREPWRVIIWESWPWISGVASIPLIVSGYARKKVLEPSDGKLGILALVFGVFLLIYPQMLNLLGSEYPAHIQNTEPDLEIRVPLDGKVRVAWGGNKLAQNYHAAFPDQRWAYDLIVDPHSIGSKFNDDYGCFGATVYAPVAGEIRTASDTEPDRKPDNNAPDIEAAFGNYIVMEPIGTDNRLIIAHLKSGSLLVERGDFVEEGAPIGQCGNSGNSTEPHVHIHYIDLHDLNGETIMTGLPLYFRDHDGSQMPTGGMQQKGGIDFPVGEIIQHLPDGVAEQTAPD